MHRTGLACSQVLLMLVATSIAHAESLSPDRKREILERGLNAFDQAADAARSDAPAAEALYRNAAGHFESLRDAGVRSPALEYNLGNTYFRLGDLGQAVACYRRALRLAPHHGDARANLDYARRRVKPEIAASSERRLLERLLFWQYSTSLAQRFWACAVFSVLGWGGLTIWLLQRRPWLLSLALAAVALGLANAGLVAWQLREQRLHPEAVVAHGEPVLRSGRGDGFEPVLREPLGPGVELRIIEQRGDWVRVELLNQQRGWLPLDALERI